MLEREADVGPRHGEPLHDVEAGGIFAALRAQELAPRRHPARTAPRRVTRVPGGSAAGPSPVEPAIVDRPRPAVGAAHPALDRQPRDAGDRRQRLAAEAQGRDLVDRIVGQLGGGVALERQRDLVRRHAAAVVGDLDPVDARRRASATAIRVAPASIAFSTSSFNALAGLSTTSPAAMRLTRCSGRRRIDMVQRSIRSARRPARRSLTLLVDRGRGAIL